MQKLSYSFYHTVCTLEQCLYRLQFPAKVAEGSVGKYTGRSEGRLDDTP
jgi:hypothetical protein